MIMTNGLTFYKCGVEKNIVYTRLCMEWPFLQRKSKRIYLDYASSTPVASFVVDELKNSFGIFENPSSIHKEGVKARNVLEEGRKEIARTIEAQPDEIIFTASGTESCVIAIRGVVAHAKRHIKTPHIIVSSIEHAAVLETAKDLETKGEIRVTYVEPDEHGVIHPNTIKEHLTEDTVLVSVMTVNNEIGTVEPIKEIGLLLRKHKSEYGYPLFHSDASQAFLYNDLSVLKLHVDLMTLDGIKCYGPRGIGVLFKKRNVNIDTPITGGGQEQGVRSGTENVGAIRGLAKALTYGMEIRDTERVRVEEVRQYAKDMIKKTIPNVLFNESETRSPHILSVCFPNCDAEYVVISLDALGIACAWGSACKSINGDTSSYVLQAIGKDECKQSTVRFSFGRETTKKDINVLCDALRELVHRKVIEN